MRTQRSAVASGLIRMCGLVLLVSAFAKFGHPAPVMDYMSSMGFEGSTLYVVAGVEFLTAVLLLVKRSRPLGALMASAYLGGAVAAHLAIHRYTEGGPFLTFMATHPYIGLLDIGLLEPGVFLVALWLGTWLQAEPMLQAPNVANRVWTPHSA